MLIFYCDKISIFNYKLHKINMLNDNMTETKTKKLKNMEIVDINKNFIEL